MSIFYKRISGVQGGKQDCMETPPLSVEAGSFCPLILTAAVLFATWLGWGLIKSRAPGCSRECRTEEGR